MIRLIRKVKNDSKNSIKINSKFVRFNSTSILYLICLLAQEGIQCSNCENGLNWRFKLSVNVISSTHHYWIKQQLLSDISFLQKKSPKSWKIKLSICAEQLGLYPEDYIFLFPFFCGKSYIFRESSSCTLIYIQLIPAYSMMLKVE